MQPLEIIKKAAKTVKKDLQTLVNGIDSYLIDLHKKAGDTYQDYTGKSVNNLKQDLLTTSVFALGYSGVVEKDYLALGAASGPLMSKVALNLSQKLGIGLKFSENDTLINPLSKLFAIGYPVMTADFAQNILELIQGISENNPPMILGSIARASKDIGILTALSAFYLHRNDFDQPIKRKSFKRALEEKIAKLLPRLIPVKQEVQS